MSLSTLLAVIFLTGADFTICNAPNTQTYPCVSFQNNQYYVFWADYRPEPEYALYGARVTSEGAVVDTNGKPLFQDSVFYPRCAYDGTNFLVIWREGCWSNGDIRGVRVTPNCDPLNSFYINQAPGVQTQPEIAFGGGVYLTMWSDAEDYFHAYGCRVTPAGTVLDPAGIRLGPDDTLRQTDPSAAYNGTSFFVIWGSTYRPRIMGRFVGTDGSLGDTLNLAVSGEDVCETRLAWSGTNYLAAWIDGSYTLNGLIVSTAGTPVGSPFTIATLVDQYSLSLCFDGTQYCVNYVQKTGSFNHVYGRKYTTAGVPVAGPYLISSGSNFEFYCEVVPGANNHYLTAWAGIYASSYDIHGNLDVPIVGIEERPASGRQKTPGATIVAGPLPRTGTRIYNGLGRLIREPNPGPGVYFYLKGGGSVGKIVKVR